MDQRLESFMSSRVATLDLADARRLIANGDPGFLDTMLPAVRSPQFHRAIGTPLMAGSVPRFTRPDWLPGCALAALDKVVRVGANTAASFGGCGISAPLAYTREIRLHGLIEALIQPVAFGCSAR
jgi:hypothetical protein